MTNSKTIFEPFFIKVACLTIKEIFRVPNPNQSCPGPGVFSFGSRSRTTLGLVIFMYFQFYPVIYIFWGAPVSMILFGAFYTLSISPAMPIKFINWQISLINRMRHLVLFTRIDTVTSIPGKFGPFGTIVPSSKHQRQIRITADRIY